MTVHEVSIDELLGIMPTGVRLIDVREVDEYVSGHIPSAINIPLTTIEANSERFRNESSTYIVCRSGGRSMKACEFLVDRGIVNVVNVGGGTMAWQASGNEVNLGEQP